jgi:NADH-quinone oxidoreductase subunit G
LSRQAPGIAQLVPPVQIGLNATDGARMGVKSGELIKVTANGCVYELEVSLRADLPRGVALVPVGIPPVEGISFSKRAKLTPAGATVQGVVK